MADQDGGIPLECHEIRTGTSMWTDLDEPDPVIQERHRQRQREAIARIPVSPDGF